MGLPSDRLSHSDKFMPYAVCLVSVTTPGLTCGRPQVRQVQRSGAESTLNLAGHAPQVTGS